MRFFSDGPIIPSYLLNQRNEGNVIFFCGAGISRRAGLPDFAGLTQDIAQRLVARKALDALDRKESSDRVFRHLVQEFGQYEIDRQIHKALTARRKADLSCHRTILDLSTGIDGCPQVVTTNFDLLFEKADHRIRKQSFEPPFLPDLSLQSSFEGVVYLHGRLRTPEIGKSSGYIISSADFGRAYLSEGWATKYVKSLREQFTIVLLGYSAEDAPMRYLLEGLSSADNASYKSPIYAFTQGDEGDAEEEWQDRGVTPICYPKSDGHIALWDTLAAWATAVRDPKAWNEKVISIAQKRPRDAAPHERGQVIDLVSSNYGAKIFSEVTPAPTGEWMCVFDPNVRYSKPRKPAWDSETEIDPLDLYGLDDDPPRPPTKTNGETEVPGFNVLGWKLGDPSFPEKTDLRGWNSLWASQLPDRLSSIAKWFASVMHEPAAVWWAAGWKQLNPQLIWFVQRRLHSENPEVPKQALTFWNLYFEGSNRGELRDRQFSWYDFTSMVKAQGWSGPLLRFFGKIAQPQVEFNRRDYGVNYPTEQSWNDLPLAQLVNTKLKLLDRHNDKIHIPSENLAEFLVVMRQSLVTASTLLAEIETDFWQMPTLHSETGHGEAYHGHKAQFFLWFRSLFVQLIRIDSRLAAVEARSWPVNDKYFFGKLSIFAAMHPTVMTPTQVCDLFSALEDDIYWDHHHQREFLFTLRSRWDEMSEVQRRSIEGRILKGPPKWKNEKPTEFRRRRAVYSAERLRWLELNDCPLTPTAKLKLDGLKKVDPQWSEEWAKNADGSYEGRSGTVERVIDTQGIETVAIGAVLDAARAKTERRFGEFRDYRPFDGLVNLRPFGALSALRRELRQGRAPTDFWQSLLTNWPDETALRLRWLLAETIERLPNEALLSLRHYLPRWLQKHWGGLADANRPRALRLFDSVSKVYINAEREITKSAIGETTVGGVVQDRSQVSMSKAINSPIGVLTQTFWHLMPETANVDGPLPEGVAERLEGLISANGDGGGHAVCVIMSHFPWLDHWFSEWTHRVLLPVLLVKNPLSEAAWHGYAYSQHWPSTKTLKVLCPSLLALLKGDAQWTLEQSERRTLIQKMVVLMRPENAGGPLISFEAAKLVFMALDEQGRSDALWMLGKIASEASGWDTFVKPFIEHAWPRQVRFRTEKTSSSFANLIESSGDSFPDAVRTIIGLLKPVPHLSSVIYRLSKKSDEGSLDFAQKHPSETLMFLDALVPNDRSQMPYGLEVALQMISDAAPALQRTKAWRRLSDLVSLA
jgi:hypothetical protein